MMAVLTGCAANADITVTYNAQPVPQSVEVRHILLDQNVKSRAARNNAVSETLPVKDSKLVIPVDPAGPAQYSFLVGENNGIQIFAAPGENINVDITSIDPLAYTMKGTELVEGIQTINDATSPIIARLRALGKPDDTNKAEFEKLNEEYYNVFKSFIAANPDNAAAAFAAVHLQPEEMIAAVDALGAAAKKSIFYPQVEFQYASAKKSLEAERKIEEMQSGAVEAPNFTLKNPEGKDVSLTDFRGKWVILDFWGTWCPWCIKGFPALKEAYAKYAGKLEVIGIDCGDKEDAWKAGIEKYQLPWVHVYNPQDNKSVTDAYYIQGYPTKVIVNPEGKIADITVGENPEFFNTLDALINK